MSLFLLSSQCLRSCTHGSKPVDFGPFPKRTVRQGFTNAPVKRLRVHSLDWKLGSESFLGSLKLGRLGWSQSIDLCPLGISIRVVMAEAVRGGERGCSGGQDA